jgi:hypothetical protein
VLLSHFNVAFHVGVGVGVDGLVVIVGSIIVKNAVFSFAIESDKVKSTMRLCVSLFGIK